MACRRFDTGDIRLLCKPATVEDEIEMDWIKVEKNVPDKEQLMDIADLCCDGSIAEAFLAFFRFFAMADGETADGVITSPRMADIWSRRQGFGRALVQVGWLVQEGERAWRITNYSKHNGQNAKRRAINAANMVAIREAKRKRGAV